MTLLGALSIPHEAMVENKASKPTKAKFDLGGVLKGLLQRKKPLPDAPGAGKDKLQEEPQESRRLRPATTAAITVPPKERVFQRITILGPPSGGLHNMEQILLRRGYDVEYVALETKKRGAFEKHMMDKPIPSGCECVVLFEPSSIDQAKSAIGDVRKKGNIPLVLVSRQVSTSRWASEVLKEYDLSDRFLVRFSSKGLQDVFQRIASGSALGPPPPFPAPAPTPAAPKTPTKEPPLDRPPSAAPESADGGPQPSLVEIATKPLDTEIEEKVEVLCEEIQRPMAKLAPLALDPQVHYRVEGKESEGINPARILTRREFERLFHPRFQEKWRITRIQDPRATPPVLIEVKKLAEEPDLPPSPSVARSEDKPSTVSPVSPKPDPRKKRPDLSDKIREVRKRWQEGRLVKLCNDMEQLRASLPNLRELDAESITPAFIPLIEGTILFAKSRLDRTVETTLEEFFREDFARNGLQAPLRLMALIAAGRDDAYKEAFDAAEQTVSNILTSLLPVETEREKFDQAAHEIQAHLNQLDELVEETFQLQKITAGQIFDYFDKLQKITVHLHQEMMEIDENLLIFGRLDRVILGSQTRSDWAFDHAEKPEQWQDRLHKFLRFLAEIRIETLQVRRQLDLLTGMGDRGIAAVVAEVASRPSSTETVTAETLIRIDEDHLQEPQNETVWHIHRHRANYLIDLIHEEDPNIRAFATFDEENIAYSWLGVYQATAAQMREHAEAQQDAQHEDTGNSDLTATPEET